MTDEAFRGDTGAVNVLGHRGASRARAENTPEAFRAADEMGADGVELDIRLAPDGHGSVRLVVFHDPLPDDQNDLDALPGFEEVLAACGSRMLVNVEIKNSEGDGGFDPTMTVVAPTTAAMRRRGSSSSDRWLISSFSLPTIDHCRVVASDIPTALLVVEPTDAAIAAAVEGGHAALHPRVGSFDDERVAACHAVGLLVNAWTCNDPDRLVELDRWGVDGVCTDVPDVALAALGRSAEVESMVRPVWGTRA